MTYEELSRRASSKCVSMLRPDLSSSLLSYEDLGPRGSGKEADFREKDVTRGAGTYKFALSSPLCLIPTPSPGTPSGIGVRPMCLWYQGAMKDFIHPAEPPIDVNK